MREERKIPKSKIAPSVKEELRSVIRDEQEKKKEKKEEQSKNKIRV